MVTEKATKSKGKYFYACGRRKTAVARVYLRAGTGEVEVNKRDLKNYFPVLVTQQIVLAPLEAVGALKKFDLSVRVCGGGPVAQAVAARHGVSRALLLTDDKLRATLKPLGYLERDAREKERKKPGKKRARRGRQFSKR